MGDYDYLVTAEASTMAIMLLSDADYEVLLGIPPNVLEFDCVVSRIVRSEGKMAASKTTLMAVRGFSER